MKMLLVLAVLLLVFQVEAAPTEPAQWQADIQSWNLDELSPYYYDDISSVGLTVDLGRRLVTLTIQTDRHPQIVKAELIQMKSNSCGAQVIKAFDDLNNRELIVRDFRLGQCPRKDNHRGIEIEARHFEMKSLNPSVDLFYASHQAEDANTQAPRLEVSEVKLELIEWRNRLQLPTIGL